MTNARNLGFMRFIGLVPIAVGVLLLAEAWTGFGDSPMRHAGSFGRLFASLVAVIFLFVGAGFLFAGGGRKDRRGRERHGAASQGGPQQPGQGWNCPQCGAPLAEDTRISPSGDVLCPFCDNWFNVRG